MGLRRLRSLVCHSTRGLLASPRCGFRTCFHVRRPCLEGPSAKNCRSWVHPSLTLSPLQSSFAMSSRPTPFGAEALPTSGLVPLRDITGQQPLTAEFSSPPLWAALRFSQPLGGLIHQPALGLVSSRSHVQGSARSGASHSAQQSFLVESTLPPRRSACNCSPTEVGCHSCMPRPRGFAPREAALPRFGITHSAARSPPRVLFPPGSRLSRRELQFPRAIHS